MGIHNLSKVIKTYASGGVRDLDKGDVIGKVVAMDTSNILYQFLIAIKDNVDNFQTKDGRVTTHIHAIVMKTLSLLKKGIRPIFVFDGAPPAIKQGTLDARKVLKEKAMQRLEDETNDDERTKLKKRAVYISMDQMAECKEVLSAMGIPYVESLEEADPQCVYLVKKGIADAVGSEDMDILTFGAKKLYRNINNNGKVVEYDLDVILDELEMDRKEFIDMCILLGCDYCPTIEGVGMKRAHDLIKEYGSIEQIIKLDKYKVTEEFLQKYPLARAYFRKAPVQKIKKDDVVWNEPNEALLRQLLLEKYEYSVTNVDSYVATLRKKYVETYFGKGGNGDGNIIKKCKYYDNEDMFSD